MNYNKLFYVTVAGLVILPANIAYAEEDLEILVEIEEQAPETEPAPEPKIIPEPEPVTEPEVIPEPGPTTNDDAGTWSVVDSDGNVVNAIVCKPSVCGEGGALSEPGLLCDGCTVHFQQPGHAGYRSAGDTEVTYNEEDDTHSIKYGGQNEDGSESSVTIIQRNGQTLEDETITNFFEEIDEEIEEKATVTTSSVRPPLYNGSEQLVDAGVEVEFESLQQRLEYMSKQEAVDNIATDVETVVDETEQPEGFRQSIMNLVTKVVSFLSSLIN